MSTAMTISIPRATGRCAGEDRRLEPGEAYVVVLTEAEGSESLERTDYSRRSWEAGARPAGPIFASWHAVAATGEPTPERRLSAESLLDLFEQLAEAEDPRRRALRYVIGLQLMRRRQLEPAGRAPGGMLVRMRGAPPEQEPMLLHDPQAAGELDEAALAELASQLELLMDAGDAS
jgi:hypothetical protein